MRLGSSTLTLGQWVVVEVQTGLGGDWVGNCKIYLGQIGLGALWDWAGN